MLYSVDSNQYVKTIPHKERFAEWMEELSSSEYQAIIDELNNRIDGTDNNTSIQ